MAFTDLADCFGSITCACSADRQAISRHEGDLPADRCDSQKAHAAAGAGAHCSLHDFGGLQQPSVRTGAWKTLLCRPASLMPENAAYGLASAMAAASACLAASASLLVAQSDRRALAMDSGPARKRAYMSSVLALRIREGGILLHAIAGASQLLALLVQLRTCLVHKLSIQIATSMAAQQVQSWSAGDQVSADVR